MSSTGGATDRRPGGRYRWRLADPAPGEAASLARALGLPLLVGGLLWNRGLSSADAARRFLDAAIDDLHDPFLMRDMDRAADRIVRAVGRGERIIVYGDYDADGVCSSALLVHFLRSLGNPAEVYIPDRMREGYGLNTEALLRLAAGGEGLLITVDNGISNVAEVKAARAAGLDVIITDHHQPPEELPRAYAVLNPNRPDCPYPDKSLCGTAIAFKLLIALRRVLRDAGGPGEIPNLKRYLDWVALATVADVSDVQGENRVLLRHGLRELAASARPGVRALVQVSGARADTFLGARTLSYGQVAFQLAPRINAAGRLGHARLALDLLLETDDGAAAGLAGRLDDLNRERQALQEKVLDRARERVLAASPSGGDPIVLAEAGWHTGVLGIVAAKLAEEFRRPAILIGLEGDLGVGSGRSVGTLHLQRALAEVEDLLEKFGGHRQAAGLTIRRENLPAFTDRFSEIVRGRITEDDLSPVLDLDGRVGLADLTIDALEALERLSPHGPGNRRPAFCAEGLRVAGGVRTVGRDGRHLKIELHDPATGCSAEAIGFGMGAEDGLDFLQSPAARVDAAFEPEINRWNGRASLQLNLKDIRPGA